MHFNLTQGLAVSKEYQAFYGIHFSPLSHVIFKSLSRQWRPDILEYECHAQINAFITQMGFLPDFLDGHQHIHLFPVIFASRLEVVDFRRDIRFLANADRLVNAFEKPFPFTKHCLRMNARVTSRSAPVRRLMTGEVVVTVF